ncbi:hypothetical protein [Streptomyces sp. NPDC058773]|uniref:hypothetical protein n=1 Tax=Streptomyces sp. NPDC058773 TaxID=3346632 RepID=UPI00369CFCA2
MSRALRALAALIALHRGRQSIAAAHFDALAAATDVGTVAWFYEYLPLRAHAFADEAQGDPESAYVRLAAAFDHGVGNLPSQLILGFLAPTSSDSPWSTATPAVRSATHTPRPPAPDTAARLTTSAMTSDARDSWQRTRTCFWKRPTATQAFERGACLHRRGRADGPA